MIRFFSLQILVLVVLQALATAAWAITSPPSPPSIVQDVQPNLTDQVIERFRSALPIELEIAVQKDLDGAFSGKRCDELGPLVEADASRSDDRLLPRYLHLVCAQTHGTITDVANAQTDLNLALQQAERPVGDHFDDTIIHVTTGFDALAYRYAKGYSLLAEFYDIAGGGRRLYDVMIVKKTDSPRQITLRFDLTEFSQRMVAVAFNGADVKDAQALLDSPATTMLRAMAQEPSASPPIVAGWALYLSTTPGKSMLSPEVQQLLDRAATPSSIYARFAKARALLFDTTNMTAASQAHELMVAVSRNTFAEPEAILAAMAEKGIGMAKDASASSDAFKRAEAALGRARAEYRVAWAFLPNNSLLHDEERGHRWLKRSAEDGDAWAQIEVGNACASSVAHKPDYRCALDWYAKAAAQGDPSGMLNLGDLYEKGWGVAKDYELARQFYEKASVAGDNEATVSVGLMYWRGRGVKQDYQRAVALFKIAAEWGSPWGQNDYALGLTNGQGVTKDVVEGVRWFQLAASQGNRDATMYLAAAYENGRGVNPDPSRAVQIYTWLADTGHVESMLRLATMAANGRGLGKNMPMALELLERAANQGNTEGMRRLGVAYFDGENGTANQALGLSWMRKSAEAGDAEGMRALGISLHQAGGKDPTEALKWLVRAADAGNTEAFTTLGSSYEYGFNGVPVDSSKAMQWYRKGADLNDAEAINNYGRFVRAGKNVDKDSKLARALFEKAVSLGSSYAKCNLGEMLDVGEGGDADRERAWKLMIEAADSGNKVCQSEAGLGYRYGAYVGRKIDLALARHYFELGSRQGDELSQAQLAELTLFQDQQDPETLSAARASLEQLADKGVVRAQFLLANECIQGHAAPTDYGCARRRFEQATEHGLVAAYRMMGVLDASGLGGPQNLVDAERWYRKAAEGGDTKVNYGFGHLLLHDRRVVEAWERLRQTSDDNAMAATYLILRYCKTETDCPLDSATKTNLQTKLSSLTSAQKNEVAWDLATDALSDREDGSYAVETIQSLDAKEKSGWNFFDTAAAAYARAGKFDEATSFEARALEKLPGTAKRSLRRKMGLRLSTYQARQPCNDWN